MAINIAWRSMLSGQHNKKLIEAIFLSNTTKGLTTLRGPEWEQALDHSVACSRMYTGRKQRRIEQRKKA